MSNFTLKTASESYQTDNRSELQAIIIACGDDALLYPIYHACKAAEMSWVKSFANMVPIPKSKTIN